MYTITPKAARCLMEIEAARADIEQMPLPPTVEAELRRQARVLLAEWVGDGWLVVSDPSRRKQSYELTAIYRQYIGMLSAIKQNEPKNGKAGKRRTRDSK